METQERSKTPTESKKGEKEWKTASISRQFNSNFFLIGYLAIKYHKGKKCAVEESK